MIRIVVAVLTMAGLALTASAQDTGTDPLEAPVAQDSLSADQPASPVDVPEDATATTAEAAGPVTMSGTLLSVDTDNLATGIMGATVYSSSGSDAQTIGTVNDLVVGDTGQIAAIILGVGGFIGIGEKNVAVDFAQLQWSVDANGNDVLVLPVSAEALSAAPAFAWDSAARAEANAEEAQVDPTANTVTVDPALTTDQPDAVAASAPLDRDTMADVDITALRAEQLLGIAVYGINDEQIGTIGDLILTPEGGVDAVIVDVGGFLGIGQKEVAVGFENLAFATDVDAAYYLFLNATREQLEAQPPFDQALYATDRETQRLVVSP